MTNPLKWRRMAALMGKFDRRNSMKMKRRKAQVKKKARIKKQIAAARAAGKAPAPKKKKS